MTRRTSGLPIAFGHGAVSRLLAFAAVFSENQNISINNRGARVSSTKPLFIQLHTSCF